MMLAASEGETFDEELGRYPGLVMLKLLDVLGPDEPTTDGGYHEFEDVSCGCG